MCSLRSTLREPRQLSWPPPPSLYIILCHKPQPHPLPSPHNSFSSIICHVHGCTMPCATSNSTSVRRIQIQSSIHQSSSAFFTKSCATSCSGASKQSRCKTPTPASVSTTCIVAWPGCVREHVCVRARSRACVWWPQIGPKFEPDYANDWLSRLVISKGSARVRNARNTSGRERAPSTACMCSYLHAAASRKKRGANIPTQPSSATR